jgi:hypothetical protein
MCDKASRNSSSTLAQRKLPDGGSPQGSSTSLAGGKSSDVLGWKSCGSPSERTNFPGDGICPSTSQFNEIFKSTYDTWKSLTSTFSDEDDEKLFCRDSFLELLEEIPPFAAPPLEQVRTVGTEDLICECALEWKTSTHPEYDQREKVMKFYQVLACSQPVP